MSTSLASFIPASILLEDLGIWPAEVAELDGGTSVLDRIGVQDVGVTETETQTMARFTLVSLDEVAFKLPGLSGVALVFGSSGQRSEFKIEVQLREPTEFRLIEIAAALRFSSEIVQPVRKVNGKFELDPSKSHIQIQVKGTIVVSAEGIRIEGMNELGLEPCMIGNSGVIIEAPAVLLNLASDSLIPEAAAAGLPQGWVGVFIKEASINLPPELGSALPSGLSFKDCSIGSGGFSGQIDLDWTPPFAGGIAEVEFQLNKFVLEFRQNSLARSEIRGRLVLPFFDEPLDIELGFSSSGSVALKLGAESGIVELTKQGVLSIKIDTLGMKIGGGVFVVSLSGKVTPLFGQDQGLEWPTFDVKELSIDSQGNVHLEGGWLNLPSQYSLDFHGFQIEITKLGFGKTEDGGKWIGFSGGLKLMEGLPAGASVEGLRIIWYSDERDPRITLNGVGVEFEVPETLRFKGAISYRELEVAGESVKRFDGAIKLELLSLDLEVDAILVIGQASGPQGSYGFMAIYLGVELPAGIPLWSTGLALYGAAGLFALQMEPDKQPEEEWYGVGPTDGWYKRPEIGVTDLKQKWVNRRDSLALGAGVTIGTLADNGYIFSGRMILVIIFPGPILLIEGKANLLKPRNKLSDEPIFRALVVLDCRAGSFLVGLDARYKFGDGGELIDIHGGAEAFFSFSDPGSWHLYLGEREPREKRIRAQILSIFEANTYLMLDAHQLATGSWVGYDKHWGFGPLKVTVEAWIESNVIISWYPPHFYGDLWLHGKAELSVFGFGLGMGVDARVAADVFDPFHVLAELSVGINLPWPLPDFDVDITLEWGPTPTAPPLPLPLKEVAVEHFKVTTSWPLPRTGEPLLLPNYDGNGDGFLEDPQPPVAAQEAALPPAHAPVVPLDCRPHITFSRSVHNDAVVGENPQPHPPDWEWIGDPSKNEGPVRARYGLQEVALHAYVGGAWQLAARKVGPSHPQQNAPETKELFGSWAPVPQLPSGAVAPGSEAPLANVKLWLWSLTPFNYTRHTGRAWDEWFTAHFPNYPCIAEAPDREVCCDFEKIPLEQALELPWHCPENPELVLSGKSPDGFTVTALMAPVQGKTRALCFDGRAGIELELRQPAQSVRLVLVESPTEPVETCVDFSSKPTGPGRNPRVEAKARFTVCDHAGTPMATTTINNFGGWIGLDLGHKLVVDLPCPADAVALTLVRYAQPAAVEALDENGKVVSAATMHNPQGQPETLRLQGAGIVQVIIRARANEALLLLFCFTCGGTCSTAATAYDGDGKAFGPFAPERQVISLHGENLVRLRLTSHCRLCLVQFCANFGPDPQEVAVREAMAKHLVDELARWASTGEVLQANTDYRLKVVTTLETADFEPDASFNRVREMVEFAYFRTEGPPGLTRLSRPVHQQDSPEFHSGLEDLTAYVEQTVPATVPAPGEKPPLPRPVYRAYDVGVDFNENYVDLMYRLSRRDLGLYLYDNNNRPVRDARGRLIILSNRWGVTEDLQLTESEELWVTLLNQSTCAALDTQVIPHNKTLVNRLPGVVLNPDTVYEARLVPLLLHEDFGDFAPGTRVNGPAGTLGRWRVLDQGTNETPSAWEVREEGAPPDAWRYLVQTANIWGNNTDGRDPNKPGTLWLIDDDPQLPPDHDQQPGNWTDYRVSVFLRAADDDAMGLVFRYQDAQNYYRFSMDRERRYRRVVRVIGGRHTILAEDDFVYQLNQDYLITVEAIGPSLRIYQDGALLAAVSDDTLSQGGVGLYCWANAGARFTDLRVDDFREQAPALYRFKFTTSRFAHFCHHLHSFQDETWRLPLPPEVDLALLSARGGMSGVLPGSDEQRAYQELIGQVFGQAGEPSPAEVQVSRLEQDNAAGAFLLQSPEPIDWSRTDLEVWRADGFMPPTALPGAVKLTEVAFGATQANEEAVTLLLREATDLTRNKIEYRHLPGPVAEPPGPPLLFMDEFDTEAGLLFQETFGPNALDHYRIVDEGQIYGPSLWSVAGNCIVQTSNIMGGNLLALSPTKPGTLAIIDCPAWRNIRIRAQLRSEDDDAIGTVFRFVDRDNYYRFSMDRQRGYRRLIKKTKGITRVLHEDRGSYNVGQSYRLTIDTFEDLILIYLDQALWCSLRDGDWREGQVGWYCWANTGACFEALKVESLESSPILWQPDFADLSDFTVVDAPGALQGPSRWQVMNGILSQTSSMHRPDIGAHRPGTFLLGGSPDWQDVQLSVALSSDGVGALGVMFRVSPELDAAGQIVDYQYYRFSMDRQAGYRRLVKNCGGVVTVLWQDGVAYHRGQRHELTLRAIGPELTGYLDGVHLFTVYDGDLQQGKVGLYCWANAGAHFARMLVTDGRRLLGRWTVRDAGQVNPPSRWRMSRGALAQHSMISGGGAPDFPGTVAIAGEPGWRDYRLTARLRSDSGGGIGLVFRWVDDDNYYRFSLDAQRSFRRLIKKEQGVVTTLWEDTFSYQPGEPFTLTIDAIGPHLAGYQDDNLVFAGDDGAHLAGRIGLYCWGNPGARCEWVEVQRPPLYAYVLFADQFADHLLTDWSFVDQGNVSAPAQWAVDQGALRQTSNIYSPPVDRDTLPKPGAMAIAGDPGWRDVVLTAHLQSMDDDALGLVCRYQDGDNYYRFSMDSQRAYRRLVKNVGGVFTLLWEDRFAYEVGRRYEVSLAMVGSTIRGYLDGVPMFVVEDGDLATGRIGLYTWANQDARFSHIRVYPASCAFADWLLDDPLTIEHYGRWSFHDQGDRQGPSAWEFTGAELRQTSNIYGGPLDGRAVAKPGTYTLAGDQDWTDYRLSVRLRSDDDDAIGLMFRYQDPRNYYRFSMDRQRRYRRLIKKVNGVVQVLWQDQVQYQMGREYLLTIDCLGGRLAGYLDGVPLFALEDHDLGAGNIGLYCWANTGARFREVRVAAPAWSAYYLFGREERLPAGTRLKVYAGNEKDAPASEPGVVRRFIARLSDPGRLHLAPSGTDLRLSGSQPPPGHCRRFFPHGHYAPVAVRYLRKADGTGFCILPDPAGGGAPVFPPGTYRLTLTYRRDNRAKVPESQVLMEAGDSNPEPVILDLPWQAH